MKHNSLAKLVYRYLIQLRPIDVFAILRKGLGRARPILTTLATTGSKGSRLLAALLPFLQTRVVAIYFCILQAVTMLQESHDSCLDRLVFSLDYSAIWSSFHLFVSVF